MEAQLVTESHLSIVRWKRARSRSSTFRSTPRGSEEVRVEKKLDIDLDAERWYTKDKRECLLHKKGGVRIDG